MGERRARRPRMLHLGCGLTLVLVLLVAVGGAWLTWQSVSQTTIDAAERLLTAASQGQVTQHFYNEFVSVEATQRLTVVEFSQISTFFRRDRRSTLWEYVPLGEVAVAVRVPATFTYYVDLNHQWQFEQRGPVLHVVAPPIQVGRPAAEVSRIEFQVQGSWLRREEPVVEELRKAIDEKLRAAAVRSLPLVREQARAQLREFVMGWVIGRYGVPAAEVPIEISFADEGALGETGTRTDGETK